MKNAILILAAMIWLPLTLQAQVEPQEVEYFQMIFGSEKKVIMASFIRLEGEQRDAFWTLYDQYEAERQELGRQRMRNLETYAEQYPEMTDEQADAVIQRAMQQQKAVNKLIDNYHKKIRKATDATAAAQFYHLENFFLAAIRVNILESLPVIGELGN